MNLYDKRAWLDKQGYTTKFDYQRPDMKTIRWTTYGGLQFRSDGDTHWEAWDNLFEMVKETLYFRTNFGKF